MSSRHAAFFLSIWIASLTLAMTTWAQVTKIDPLIRVFTEERSPSPNSAAAKSITIDERGQEVIDCFVAVYDPAKAQKIAQQIEELGGIVRSIMDNVMTVYLPVPAVSEVSAWDQVKYIEVGKPLLRKNDSARSASNVNAVQAGTGLNDVRYDGSGVIVGIVDDTAFDWGHADFKDANGKVRTLFFWDKSKTGSGVSEISGSGGIECSKAKMDAGTCTATSGGDTTSHSTHVGGTAAGDDVTYKGMAPGADIIAVFNVETDAKSGGNLATTIVDDVRYVFAKASSLGQPAVVNLSLGTSIGAHDSTSLMETSLNNLVGEPGRAIVNAAGNENFNTNDTGAATYNGLHGDIDTSTVVAFDFAVRSASSLGSLGDQMILDVWLTAASSCTVELDAFDFDKTTRLLNMSAVSAGSSSSDVSGAAGTSGTVTLNVDFTDSTNANNGKKHASATVTFSSGVTNAQMENLSFDLIFRGTCAGDLWLWPDRNGTNSFTKRFNGQDRGFGYSYTQGDSNKTITIPATASNLIAVGSYMGRSSWTDQNGTTHSQTASSGTDFTSLGATGGTLNNISLFSSLGPTADGRMKPDVSAPGEAVVSSKSANASVSSGRVVDANHFKNEGTSMSAPGVTGIVALMFQRNKCLTASQVKTLLKDNAATDSFTGTGSAVPNKSWGAGKADALATMKAAAAFNGTCGTTGSNGAPSTPVTTTSGEAGGGGCSLIQKSNIKNQKSDFWVSGLSFCILIFGFWMVDRGMRIR